MKRVILIILVLLVVLGVGKACIRRDLPTVDKPVLREKAKIVVQLPNSTKHKPSRVITKKAY